VCTEGLVCRERPADLTTAVVLTRSDRFLTDEMTREWALHYIFSPAHYAVSFQPDSMGLIHRARFSTMSELITCTGYNYIKVDPKDGSYGGDCTDPKHVHLNLRRRSGMFSKLLLHELPDYFKPGEGHAHFPLVALLKA
jgi:hypothetical protein